MGTKTETGKLKLNMKMPQMLVDYVQTECEKLNVSPEDYLEHLVWFDWEIKTQSSLLQTRVATA